MLFLCGFFVFKDPRMCLVHWAQMLTRISWEMSNRNVHFFGVYTLTNMLDKKITKYQLQQKWGKNFKNEKKLNVSFVRRI